MSDLGREDEAEMHERSAIRSRALAGPVTRYRVAVLGSASSRGSASSVVRFSGEFRAEGSDAREFRRSIGAF